MPWPGFGALPVQLCDVVVIVQRRGAPRRQGIAAFRQYDSAPEDRGLPVQPIGRPRRNLNVRKPSLLVAHALLLSVA